MMFAGEGGSQTVVTIYKVRAWLLHGMVEGKVFIGDIRGIWKR